VETEVEGEKVSVKQLIRNALKNPERIFNRVRIKEGITGVAGNLRCKIQKSNYPDQQRKVKNLGEEYLLIILDACRYDIFLEEFNDFLEGELEPVWSSGVDTFRYMRNIWDGYYDLVYVSGAVPINSAVDDPTSVGEMYGDYIPKRHFKEIVDAWDSGWRDDLGTVPPSNVTEEARKKLDEDKLVVHYYQPHAPFIGDYPLLGKTGSNVGKNRGNPPDGVIWDRVRGGKITDRQIRKAYRSNLRLVLDEVSDLVEDMDSRKVVITADHGELLGDDGLYSHPWSVNHPKLRKVPWLEVES